MKKQTVGIVCVTVVLALGLALAFVTQVGRSAAQTTTSGEASASDPEKTPAKIVLAAPEWKIGDWFELRISLWRGYAIGASPDEVEWEPPQIMRYEIVGEEMMFGYQCFVLRESWKNEGRTQLGVYLFRQPDLSLICVRTHPRKEGDQEKWVEQYGQSPRANVGMEIGLAPGFPAREGVQKAAYTQFTDADGQPVARRSEAEHWELPTDKPAQAACVDKVTRIKNTASFVQVEYGGYVCRWVPGQLWWAQCWQEPGPAPGSSGTAGKKAAFYRAALYATSRDGVLDYPLPNAAKGGVTLEQKVAMPSEVPVDNREANK